MKITFFGGLGVSVPIAAFVIAIGSAAASMPNFPDQATPDQATLDKATLDKATPGQTISTHSLRGSQLAQVKPRPKAKKASRPSRPVATTTRVAQIPTLIPSFNFQINPVPNSAYPRVNGVDLSRDGLFAVAGSDDGAVRLWNLTTGLIVQTMNDSRKSAVGSRPFQSPSRTVAFSPDSKFVASGSGPGVAIFDVATGALVKTYPRTNNINALAYSPDGTKIAAASAGVQLPATYPGSIEILDVNTFSSLISIPVPNGGVRSLSFSPDGQSVAAARVNGEVAIYDVNTGQLKISLGNIAIDYVMGVAFSPDGRTLVTSGGSAAEFYEGQVKLWDVQTGQMLKLAKNGSRTETIAYSPDGTKVVAGNTDGAIRVYALPNLNLIAQSGLAIVGGASVHSGFVNSVAFSNDGKLILSGSIDQSIKGWRP